MDRFGFRLHVNVQLLQKETDYVLETRNIQTLTLGCSTDDKRHYHLKESKAERRVRFHDDIGPMN